MPNKYKGHGRKVWPNNEVSTKVNMQAQLSLVVSMVKMTTNFNIIINKNRP
jgi:hypothetical protein